MRILTVEEMRRVEAAADESGHSYAEMMEQAGRGVAEAIAEVADQALRGKRVLILVGPGNNGGDGLVAARYLSEAGADVSCYLLKPRADDDPNFQVVQGLELFVADADNDQRWRVLRQLVANADVIIDALLGTGVRLPLKGTVAQLLQQVSAGLQARRAEWASACSLITPGHLPATRSAPLVVAVDGPSGLNYDTGELDPQALPADLTVTFAFPKLGHFRFPGAAACGALMVADIGVDPKLVSELLGDPTVQVATSQMIASLLPKRPRDSHKGTFGKALLVVGSINYTGAAYLAASGAARVGAGLVTLAVPAAIHGPLAAKISEATFLILPQVMGIIAPNGVGLLMEKMKNYQAVLLGSGLTQEKEAVEFVHKLFRAGAQPKRKGPMGFQTSSTAEKEAAEKDLAFPSLVVDADGLNALALLEGEAWWQRLPASSVLTPHPGEMARLVGIETREVQADRLGLSERWPSSGDTWSC